MTIEQLTQAIEADPDNLDLYIERGRLYVQQQCWGSAINDFNRVLEVDPDNAVARSCKGMISNILEFKNTDLWNP